MGTGNYFGDVKNPKVVVQVGQPGDAGVLEIVDMLFTVKGATAGAILMEWNVHESTQGSGNVATGTSCSLAVSTNDNFSRDVGFTLSRWWCKRQRPDHQRMPQAVVQREVHRRVFIVSHHFKSFWVF